MVTRLLLLSCVFLAGGALAEDEYQKGCKRAATEVLCAGHAECVIGPIIDKEKKGVRTEQAGYDECKEFASFVKSKGLTTNVRRAIARLKADVEKMNKESKPSLPFITFTADFGRLELEELVNNARHLDVYGRDSTPRSLILRLSADESADTFARRYVNPVKTAMLNAAKDDIGKEALKARVKEVRLQFRTHAGTAWNPEFKLADQVLTIPSTYPLGEVDYAMGLDAWLGKNL